MLLVPVAGAFGSTSAGDLGLIPGLERSPGEGNGNPLQYSCLENPMKRGVWQATVHGIARVEHDSVTKPPPPQDRELKDALKTVKIITVFKSIGVSFI